MKEEIKMENQTLMQYFELVLLRRQRLPLPGHLRRAVRRDRRRAGQIGRASCRERV